MGDRGVELRERVALWLRPAFYLGHNAVTLLGVILTTSAGITLLGFWAFEILRGGPIHPYTGIFYFLMLPTIFALGLVLMPAGALWRRWKLRTAGEIPEAYPKIDLHEPLIRRALVLVAVASFLNATILGTATYRGVEHMDSVQFCGSTCHNVMAPQFTAYQDSPHSRVACVKCHIGPGAPWFVRSKLSGARQVFAVMLKTYSRPIPSPVKELRPARETCEQCHWPQKFEGDRFWVRTKFSDDQANTAVTTVLVLKVGGRTWQGSVGIHGRHLDTFERISYVSTDGRRQVIPRVSYMDDSGKTVEYVSSEMKPTPEQIAGAEHRRMDCMDCHNRPTHVFQLPERALDQALADDRISRQLPFIKKKAVEALRTEYSDRDTAVQRIGSALHDFYRTSYPDNYRKHRVLIEAAMEQVQAIYLRNVFPEMKIAWGTYPNNLGHEDSLGCFRCHDGQHSSSDGRTITQDCNACHTILAMEESNPKILSDLGLK